MVSAESGKDLPYLPDYGERRFLESPRRYAVVERVPLALAHVYVRLVLTTHDESPRLDSCRILPSRRLRAVCGLSEAAVVAADQAVALAQRSLAWRRRARDPGGFLPHQLRARSTSRRVVSDQARFWLGIVIIAVGFTITFALALLVQVKR